MYVWLAHTNDLLISGRCEIIRIVLSALQKRAVPGPGLSLNLFHMHKCLFSAILLVARKMNAFSTRLIHPEQEIASVALRVVHRPQYCSHYHEQFLGLGRSLMLLLDDVPHFILD